MVNIPVYQLLIFLIPLMIWIVGIVTRIPIVVLLAGIMFIAVGGYIVTTDLPNWSAITFGVLGIFIIIGTFYTMK